MPDTNNTTYPLKIKHMVDELDKFYDAEKEFILYYQYVTREYLVKSATRGLLIYHSTGFGKSIVAASISDYYRKFDPKRRIIVLLSKSLQTNFENNVRKYMKNNPNNSYHEKSEDFIDETLEIKYKFVSLNASNMFSQLSTINKAIYEEELDKNLDKNLGEFHDKVSGFLENSLLIIDEFHNLSNAITNGSKNAVKLYNTIMNTRNIKLVFLTGTPIINNPFELVPTFNMLKGYIHEHKLKYTLFPESREEFVEFFIKDGGINNKERFQNRIFGLVSYYGDFFFNKKNKKDFPVQKDLIVENVPMSLYQFGRYREAREIEIKEEANKHKKSDKIAKFVVKEDAKSSMSSYRIRSRQISNYFIPEYALTFKKSRTSVTKHIGKIKQEDLDNLKKFSPKFERIINNIDKHSGQLGVVYSEFVSGEGLILFSLVLERHGYVFWEKSELFNKYEDDLQLEMPKELEEKSPSKNTKTKGIKNTFEKTYALITGDVPFSERQRVINMFNSKKNMHGQIISLLLISKSGAEGLSLRHVRHIHIMEPFWNSARIEQVIARGVRYRSHLLMPESEQNVQPYIYISTFPKGYKKKLGEKTTDEEIFSSALNGKILKDEFELAMIQASIDCSLNYQKLGETLKDKLSCYLCMPNDKKLFEPDLYKELAYGNPCKPVTAQKEIKAQEIKVSIDGVDTLFYYTKEDDGEIKIFKYSEELGGYVALKKSYPYYADIVRKIIFVT